MRELAFELPGSPIELVGADGFELIEFGPEDSKVDIMAKINPHEYKQRKIWTNERMIEVIKGLGGLLMLGLASQFRTHGEYSQLRKSR